jgi:tetratricopeptide (TPR) repeat protein
VQEAHQIQSPLLATIASGLLAAIYTQQRQLEKAEATLDRALGTLTPELHSSPSEHHSGTGFAGSAIEWEALSLGQRVCFASYARLLLVRDEPELALWIVNELNASSPNIGASGVIPQLEILRGEALIQLERYEPSRIALETAQKALATREDVAGLWRIHSALATLCQKQGDLPAAQTEFAVAHEYVERLAATVTDNKLRDNFLKRALRVK